MPRAWFRHEATMRFDPAVEKLGDEFGPIGALAWERLLELRCQSDGDVVATVNNLGTQMCFPPGWGFDPDAWLRRAAQLRLLTFRRGRNDRLTIAIRSWNDYQPSFERPADVAERKRRSRARLSQSGHSDQRDMSHPTGRDGTGQNVTTDGLDLVDEKNCLEEVTDVGGVEDSSKPVYQPESTNPKADSEELGEGELPEDVFAARVAEIKRRHNLRGI